MRSGVITLEDLPREPIELFGRGHRERINAMVENVVSFSDGREQVQMDPVHWKQLNVLRDFMFANVYRSQKVKREEDLAKIDEVIRSLYEYFLSHSDKLPADHYALIERDGLHVVVKDYIAGMTDRYALSLYAEIFRSGTPVR